MINSPATGLDSEGDSELGELEHMRETEFVRDVDATTEEATSTRRENAALKPGWLTRWQCEYGYSSSGMRSRVSMVKITGYLLFDQVLVELCQLAVVAGDNANFLSSSQAVTPNGLMTTTLTPWAL